MGFTLCVAKTSWRGESKQVERGAAIASVEGTQTLDLLGFGDQPVTESDLGLHVVGAVLATLGQDLCHLGIGHQRRRVANRFELLGHIRIGIVDQEVGQLHDVTVGVVELTVGRGVGHGNRR